MTKFQFSNSFRTFSRLRPYLRQHRADFYFGCLFSFLKKVFDIAPEIIIGVVIDVVVNKQDSFLARWGISDAYHQLLLLSGLTLLIWIGESLCEFAHLVKWRRLAQSIQHDFRLDGYRHLQKLDMAYFEDQNTGHLGSILNDDVNQLERFFNEGMNNVVQTLTSTILIGAVFFVLSPKVALMAFLPMPIVFLSAIYFQKRAAPLYLDVREKAGRLGARLSNNLSGISVIRSFSTEDKEVQHLANDSQKYVDANQRAIVVTARFNPLIRMGVLVGFLATFIFGGILALRGELNVGSYGVLVFLSQRLLWPLRDLATTVDLFERAMASADRVFGLLAVPIQLEVKKGGARFSSQLGIDFKGVHFAYKNQLPILNDVTLTVPAGKTVAIVGPTGSGKSTITKLLLHFYVANKGEILIGGVGINDCDPQDLRAQIGLVSQDVFLFDGTVFENIAYGSDGATRVQVEAAARKAYADGFINNLPEGLDTAIGERGQKLSGGQRQRIAIARVIMKNSPILIFDEATSAVDNETESAIQKSLVEISRERTTIIIAHRLSTVVHADHIYVLDQGRVVEQGTHAELLRQGRTYQQLWNLQVRSAAEHASSVVT